MIHLGIGKMLMDLAIFSELAWENVMRMKLLFLTVISLYTHIYSSSTQAAITAGCARVNITPPVGVWLSGYGARTKASDDIEDELFAKALILSDANETLALITTDLLWVPQALTDHIRQIITEKTGIPAQNILICASHTHFGPKVYNETALGPDVVENRADEAYLEVLVKTIANAVCLAHRNMQNARIGAACGAAPEIVYNRRPVRQDGKVTTTFHLPSSIAETRKVQCDDNGQVCVTFTYPTNQPQPTFGAVDPDVWVLRVDTAEGDLLASVVNFACHAVSGSTYPDWFYSISAEYPGVMMKAVEKIEGGLCMFTSGTAGDIVPLKRGREPRFQIGKALAGEVVKTLQFLPTTEEATLAAKKTRIELPLKENLPPDAILNANNSKSLTAEVQVLRIGDVYLLGLPGEVLVELGLDIKKRAGVEKLLIVTLANDSIGYVCHRQAYDQGGYESEAGANLAPGAAETMVDRALELIQELKNDAQKSTIPAVANDQL